MANAQDRLVELEHTGWRSLCDGSGSEVYAALMTDDARMVLADGTVMTREQVAESLRHAPPWASYEIDAPQLIALGDDAASLLYVGTGHRDDGSSFTAVMATTYVRQGADWKLALYQQTPTP